MSRVHRHLTLGTILLVAALAGGCGSSDRAASEANGAPSAGTTTPASQQSAPGSPANVSTRALDSIVVLGHSGTTGYDSDPSQEGVDIRANSWATGTNPKVDSIYRRLLATHPALKGHTTSLGVDGSTVDDLASQVDSMLELDPLPDVVLVQSIDNDMQCDGSDPAHEKAFGTKLGEVLTTINQKDPDAQIFFVDQWGSVSIYADATKNQPAAVSAASGTGPCDTFTPGGKLRPAGIASEQRIVDGYFHTIQRVCAAHRDCWTDDGALQKMPVSRSDLTFDLDHLSVRGQGVMAAYAWRALPAAIKDRP